MQASVALGGGCFWLVATLAATAIAPTALFCYALIIALGQAAMGRETPKGGSTATTLGRYDGVSGGGMCGSKPQEQEDETFNGAEDGPQEQTFFELEDEADTSDGGGHAGAPRRHLSRAISSPGVLSHHVELKRSLTALFSSFFFPSFSFFIDPKKLEKAASVLSTASTVRIGPNLAERKTLEAELAKLTATKLRELLPDGEPAEAALVWIQEREASHNQGRMWQGAAAVGWLIEALEYSGLHERIHHAATQLLATPFFTGNLAAMEQWSELKRGSIQALARLTTKGRLASEYEQHNLGVELGEDRVGTQWGHTPLLPSSSPPPTFPRGGQARNCSWHWPRHSTLTTQQSSGTKLQLLCIKSCLCS